MMRAGWLRRRIDGLAMSWWGLSLTSKRWHHHAKVDINPNLLRWWARDRSGLTPDDLAGAFPQSRQWESRDAAHAEATLERFARVTHTPVGYLSRRSHRSRRFRSPTSDHRRPDAPSPESRTCWIRFMSVSSGRSGIATTCAPIARIASLLPARPLSTMWSKRPVACEMPDSTLMPANASCAIWEDALRRSLPSRWAGRLVMCNGVVMNNNRRRLDPG